MAGGPADGTTGDPSLLPLIDVTDMTEAADGAPAPSPIDADSPGRTPNAPVPLDAVITGRPVRAAGMRSADVAAAILLLAALVLCVAALGSDVSRRSIHATTLAPPQSALTSVVTERTDAWGRSTRSVAGADRPSTADLTATAYGSTLVITPSDLDPVAARSAVDPDHGPALGVVQTLAAMAVTLSLGATTATWWRRKFVRVPLPAAVAATALLIASSVTAAELLHRRHVAATRATRYLVLNDTADRAISVTVAAGSFLALSTAATACALLATALVIRPTSGTGARRAGP